MSIGNTELLQKQWTNVNSRGIEWGMVGVISQLMSKAQDTVVLCWYGELASYPEGDEAKEFVWAAVGHCIVKWLALPLPRPRLVVTFRLARFDYDGGLPALHLLEMHILHLMHLWLLRKFHVNVNRDDMEDALRGTNGELQIQLAVQSSTNCTAPVFDTKLHRELQNTFNVIGCIPDVPCVGK